MIRGYFSPTGLRRRPFVPAVLDFPSLDKRGLEVRFLVDTGADRTDRAFLLTPDEADRLNPQRAGYLKGQCS